MEKIQKNAQIFIVFFKFILQHFQDILWKILENKNLGAKDLT